MSSATAASSTTQPRTGTGRRPPCTSSLGFIAGWFLMAIWRHRHNQLLAAISECRPPSWDRLMFEEYVRSGFAEAYDRGFTAGMASCKPQPTSLRATLRGDQCGPRPTSPACHPGGSLVDARLPDGPLVRERQPSSAQAREILRSLAARADLRALGAGPSRQRNTSAFPLQQNDPSADMMTHQPGRHLSAVTFDDRPRGASHRAGEHRRQRRE